MEIERCKTCREIISFTPHRCKPRWLCMMEGDYEFCPSDIEEANPVFARDETQAAEKYYQGMIDGESDGDVVVVVDYPTMNKLWRIPVRAELVLEVWATSVEPVAYVQADE